MNDEGDRWREDCWTDFDRVPIEPEVSWDEDEPAVLYGPEGEVLITLHRHIGFRPRR